MSRDMTAVKLAAPGPSILDAEAQERASRHEEGGPNSRPRDIRVLVLEDWEADVEAIQEMLDAAGARCDVVKDLQTFDDFAQRAGQRGAYAVASIDWNIGGAMEGAAALVSLRQYDPDIGKVVLSAHAYKREVESWARAEGADEVVEKIGDYSEKYLRAVEMAARKGYFRRITRCMRALGLQASGEADFESPASFHAAERNLYLEARKAVTAAFLAGEGDGELMRHAKDRGWWASFGSSHFIELPFNEKVAELLGYVALAPEQLARILEVDPGAARALLRGEEAAFESYGEAAENLERLASVLSYLLRLSQYEPDMMLYHWNARNLDAESRDPPPWDEEGLGRYLERRGPRGLQEALDWIRRD